MTAEILLAACNGEAYIRQQLDSIFAQRDPRWHLTVSDDGSSDATPEILAEYAARYPDRVTLHRSGRRYGSAKAHFFALMQACESDYMLFCDQDDVWYEDKLGRTLDALLELEAAYGRNCPALAFSDQRPTDENLVPLADSLMRYQRQYAGEIDYRAILLQNVVTGGAMGVNRALAEMALACAEPERVIMHDWWMAAVAARFGHVKYIDEALGDYRQHGGNAVGAKNAGSAAHIVRRLLNPGDVRATILAKKAQAQVFAGTYAGRLNEEDRAFLTPFTAARSGPVFYLKNRKLIHGVFRLAGLMVLG